VLVSVGGDVTLPAGDQADVLVVVNGTATIEGDVRTLVTVEGSAILTGASVDTIVAVDSSVELNPGTVVTGDISTFESQVHQVGDAVIQGEVSDIGGRLFAVGMILAPAVILFWIGLGLAMLVAGLLLAGLASRQVRMAEQVISREPILAAVVGLVGLVFFPIVAVLLIVSIVGAPLGLAVLLQVWPLLAFVGYLVAGIWIGEWFLGRFQPGVVRDRPYLAALLGVVLLQMVGLVPVLSIIAAIASLFGFGAILVLVWRTLISRPTVPTVTAPTPAPMAG
jgi:hypothetical protein